MNRITEFFNFSNSLFCATTLLPTIHLPLALINKDHNKSYVQDCMSSPRNILNVTSTFVGKREKLIKKGFLIANHRGFYDFFWDSVITKSSPVGRQLAVMAMNVAGLLTYLENRIVIFKRGSLNRTQLFQKMLDHMKKKSKYSKRVLFYPEGTRLKYQHLDGVEDLKRKFKYGILKCVYEHQSLPIQIIITSNKDKIVSEKTLQAFKNVETKSNLSKPIHPSEFETFEAFVDEVANVWYESYKLTHHS